MDINLMAESVKVTANYGNKMVTVEIEGVLIEQLLSEISETELRDYVEANYNWFEKKTESNLHPVFENIVSLIRPK